jgi:ABC-type transport system substrate-binding protein
VGFRAFVDGKAAHISGLTAPSPNAVHIATTGPLSTITALLASPELGVVKVAALDGVTGTADLDALPLSGAWQVTDAAADEVTLTPRVAAAGVDAVKLHAFDDENAAYDAFVDGQVDWATVPEKKVADATDAYGTDAFAPYQAELFWGMNVASPNLANAGLRSAIGLAIDRDAIVDAVYHDLADPLSTIVPDGVPGHDPARCVPCEPDVAKATSLVKAAYPDGKVPQISVDYDESSDQPAMAKMIAADLDAVGIPTKLNGMPLEDYKAFVVSGRQQLFTFGWIGAFTSPDAYLTRLFQSSSNDNLTAFRSPVVDALLAQARATVDTKVQQTKWAQAESTVLKSMVVVPIAQFRTQVVVSDRVQGLQHAVDGHVDWSSVTVSD